MARHIVSRLFVGLVISSLWLGLMALPVAAGGSLTLWVDDDLVAGDGPAACDDPDHNSIQDAIDASNPGDVVKVCPGTYTEQLTLDENVHVQATPLFQAHLDLDGILAEVDGMVAGVRLTADNAKFRGFRIHVPAGVDIETLLPPCTHIDVAILIQGEGNIVRQNKIDVSGEATLSGNCGYDYGIVVGGVGSIGVSPTGTGGSAAAARVTFNWVTDFKVGGILVRDQDSYAFLRRNDVRFLHANETAPCATPTGCVTNVVTGIPGHYGAPFGIGVEDGAEADIIRNAIRSGPCATPPTLIAGPPSCSGAPVLQSGIMHSILDTAETNVVFHNAIWRTVHAVVASPDADGATYRSNHLTNNAAGFYMHSSGGEFDDNRAEQNNAGIVMNGFATGNDIHDNDFRGNNSDCNDVSSGSGTAGTANTWTNNLGDTDSPDGICSST